MDKKIYNFHIRLRRINKFIAIFIVSTFNFSLMYIILYTFFFILFAKRIIFVSNLSFF